VTISVKKVSDNLYHVSATEPQYLGRETWQPSEPMDGQNLVEELKRRGWHIQDICDAMSEVDTEWVKKLKADDAGQGNK